MYSAFTDGSYNGTKNKAGAATIILKDGVLIDKMAKGIRNPKSAQIDAECMAVYMAIEWCKNNGVQEIEIFYDYTGVKHWALGEWKTTKDVTTRYRNYMKNCDVKIKWSKVKAHSGVYWNEYTDELAGQAAE
jgi:ribonuclease HI